MDKSIDEMQMIMNEAGERAVSASRCLAVMSTHDKNICLERMAAEIEANISEIIKANAKDLEAGCKNGLSAAMLDRLKVDEKRIKSMADGMRYVASLEDPVGRELFATVRPNGLTIKKISVPIGVIGIIYESRPNVTTDAAGLCLKAGNAVILRGGSEAFNTNKVLAHCLNRAGVMA